MDDETIQIVAGPRFVEDPAIEMLVAPYAKGKGEYNADIVDIVRSCLQLFLGDLLGQSFTEPFDALLKSMKDTQLSPIVLEMIRDLDEERKVSCNLNKLDSCGGYDVTSKYVPHRAVLACVILSVTRRFLENATTEGCLPQDAWQRSPHDEALNVVAFGEVAVRPYPQRQRNTSVLETIGWPFPSFAALVSDLTARFDQLGLKPCHATDWTELSLFALYMHIGCFLLGPHGNKVKLCYSIGLLLNPQGKSQSFKMGSKASLTVRRRNELFTVVGSRFSDSTRRAYGGKGRRAVKRVRLEATPGDEHPPAIPQPADATVMRMGSRHAHPMSPLLSSHASAILSPAQPSLPYPPALPTSSPSLRAGQRVLTRGQRSFSL